MSQARPSFWRRLLYGARYLHARADWDALVGAGWPDRVMQLGVTDDFHQKQGRSTGRLVLRSGGRQLAVYLKRHYRLPRWRGLLAGLWPGGCWSPALQEDANLEWVRSQGIPVPAVVAAGDLLGPWGRLQSFLAVEELTGMLGLHQAIPLAARQLAPATYRRWKAGLATELARLALLLHLRGRFHKDLYLGHFFVPRPDTARVPEWPGRVHLIDLHRLTHHPVTWPWWLVKDLAQLLYSSEIDGVDVRDRLAFWRAYLGPLRHTGRGRLLRRCVLLKARRYRDHNTKRRARAAAASPERRAG
jgi:heptose I phosphotransferase